MILRALSALWTSAAPPMADHLWQSTLFVVLAAILSFALRKNQARVRYWVWLTASVKFLIPFSLLIALGSHLARPRVSTRAQVIVYSTVEDFSQPFAGQQMPVIYRPAPTAAPVSLLPATLVAVWLVGIIVVLLRWAIGWVRISLMVRKAAPVTEGPEVDALRRLESTLDVRRPIRLVLSPDWMEPGIFGIFRPVLIWPEGISKHLDDRHVEAILAHEVCHVRRHDNLTAVLHMLVEAVFWFHPLVWWMGARLEKERERACDEVVSFLCDQPHVYAESILKVCKFCSESPLACVSGITGADLKKRIVQIMTERTGRKLNLSRRLLLCGVAVAVVALPVTFGLAYATQVRAQPEPRPTFEVASIRPCKDPSQEPPTGHRPGANSSPGRLASDCVELPNLIGNAYNAFADGRLNLNAEPTPVTGGPPWLRSAFYRINAKAEGNPSVEMMFGPMMQTLLEERFHLKIRHQTSDGPVYFLTVARGGPKMHPFTKGSCTPYSTFPPPPLQPGEKYCERMISGISPSVVAQGATLEEFAKTLRVLLDRPVIDKTGIAGRFDFRVAFSREGTEAAPDPASPPSIFTALPEQLGLRLESGRGPVDTLVIDHIERPSVDGAELSSLAPSGTAPVLVYSVEPEFTERALQAHASGDVLVNLWVDEKGNPTQVRTLRGMGMGLDQKAVEAVKQYRYTPAMQNGKHVPAQLNVAVKFQIF